MIIVFGFCIGALILQIQGVEETPGERFKRTKCECQANPATHIDDADLSRFGNGQEVDHSKLGPFLLCFNVGMGLQQPNGDLVPNFREIVSQVIPADRIDDYIKTCGKRASDDAEEAAIILSKCTNDFDPAHNPFRDP
ncbi:unnamed protein product [Phaedon cochleariae]|uniref:Uncharacterized protein n=1 Tax=Phaedon cochleariae TaxID=80249 RepID=A0A9N9SEL4_PHACE|nr:unnamed protein product [Phaedon cochleariae]